MKYFNARKVTVEYKNEHVKYEHKKIHYEAEVFSEDTERKLNLFRIARKHKKSAIKYYPRIKTVWITVPREIYNHYEQHNKVQGNN